jgi:hypothetical protein
MPNKQNEKTIGAAIDLALAEEFDKQVFGKRFKKKTLFCAFAKWWISLSEDEQKQFYSKAGDENFESFGDWVERLIDEKLSIKTEKKPEINLQESIENIIYFTRFKLPSPDQKRLLTDLRKALGPEETQKKAKQA